MTEASFASVLQERIEAAAHVLDRMTSAEVTWRLSDDIRRAMRRRGLTWSEIAGILGPLGLRCGMSTLETHYAAAGRRDYPDAPDTPRLVAMRDALRSNIDHRHQQGMPAELKACVVSIYDAGATLGEVADAISMSGWPITKSGVRKVYLNTKPDARLRPRGFERRAS